jgi:hypothetical protein
MKRTTACFVLTLLQLAVQPSAGQDSRGLTDVAVLRLQPIGPAPRERLCVGDRNSVRAELMLTGPTRPGVVHLRLALVLPAGDPAGVALAEGSLALSGGPARRSFTFANVEVPARLRGRGGVLEVRATLDRGVTERSLSNNVAALELDRAVDWSCQP